ncbi:MAG: hypothetical protein GQ564_20680 [Bacteroidales bacterium]|nr:hypothetical protein [Bacteroidales bacterium]
MDYLYIDYNAIEKIISERRFQSYEFNDSVILIDFLSCKIQNHKYHNIVLEKTTRGGFIYSGVQSKKGVIFDFENFNAFQNEKFKGEEKITILQKTLKYAMKHWNNNPLSSCEKNILDTNHSLVYPFPFTTGETYRVLIDKKADEKKQNSRGLDFLLVYSDGYDSKSYSPSLTHFKKAFEEAKDVCSIVENEKQPEGESEAALQVSNLVSNGEFKSINSHLGFDNWKFLLTNKQREFVEKDINGTERLQGAAGTGKTLSMILRCINLLKNYDVKKKEINILYLTHSVATKNQIEDVFATNLPEYVQYKDKAYSNQTISVTTLQEWCLSFLGGSIDSSEYLDIDAQDSKELQLMYIEQSLDNTIKNDFESYKEICSPRFVEYFTETYAKDKEELLELLQHEIAVTIKGRAQEDFDTYMLLPRIEHTIPVSKTHEGDLNFLFLIYESYRKSLQVVNQFDSDDIAITTLQQLNTPIWRRRKQKDGLDCIFIDETHLFNINEISVFHHLLKDAVKNNIIFVLDKSQAVGDRGLDDKVLNSSLGIIDKSEESQLKTVFRSAPQIVSLAFNILSSGASLFVNLENPLEKVNYSFTQQEEKKAELPEYYFELNDELMVKKAFELAESIKQTKSISRSNILIIATTPTLLNDLDKFSKSKNKPVEVLKRRGDTELMKKADHTNRFVIGGIDFVGGLEFDAVIICGVDKGRVPAVSNFNSETSHFIKYSWHNRMYVAITRSKYIVNLIGNKARGTSEMFESAISNDLIITKNEA